MTQQDSFAELPSAVTSRLRTSSVNEPIVLYKGTALLSEPHGVVERDVTIYHEWTPRPVIVCRYSTFGEQPFRGDAGLLDRPVTIEIPSLGIQTELQHFDGYSCGNDHRHGLTFTKPLEIGDGSKMSRVIFHVVNCRDFSEKWIEHHSGSGGVGRIELSTGDWSIIIDRTEESVRLIDTLKQTGGRAVTHRVQLSRVDQAEFSKEEMSELAALTEHFIAFVTGTWACLALPIGYVEETETWQLWNARQGRSWGNPYTWSSHLPSKCVRSVFNGFAHRFRDEDWKEPLCQTVDWYVQCRNGTAETSIILCQAALELLAWVIYIENGELLGTSGFEGLWASDRIRLLLSRMRVGFDFPPLVNQLREFKYEGNKTYADGPHAITEIRNGITHPKKNKRERLGSMGPLLRVQTSNLGLFYLECCLLGLCGYFGPFRADAVYGALYSRELVTEPVYQSADFNELLPDQN